MLTHYLCSGQNGTSRKNIVKLKHKQHFSLNNTELLFNDTSTMSSHLFLCQNRNQTNLTTDKQTMSKHTFSC